MRLALTSLIAGAVAVGPVGEVAVSGDDRVVALDIGGTVAWQAKLAAQEAYVQGVAIDRKGRVCATGWFAGTLVAGGKKLPAVGGYDALLVCWAG